MSNEVLREGELSTGQLVESISSQTIEALAQGAADLLTADELPPSPTVPSDASPTEFERPRATLRDLRAVRSLLYNRLLLEVAQRRIEKAEAIIHGYLLTWGDSTAHIGPFLVELDGANRICLTQTETDGWEQLRLPESGWSPFEELEEGTPLVSRRSAQA